MQYNLYLSNGYYTTTHCTLKVGQRKFPCPQPLQPFQNETVQPLPVEWMLITQRIALQSSKRFGNTSKALRHALVHSRDRLKTGGIPGADVLAWVD